MAGAGLESVIKERVIFNPHNPEHRRAFYLVSIEQKQHPTLRFQLEEPFSSVLLMMQAKLALWACRDFAAKVEHNSSSIKQFRTR